MKKVIEMLNEHNVIRILKIADTIVPPPETMTDEEKKAAKRIAHRLCVEHTLETCDDLNDAFLEMCYEMGMNKVLNYIEKEIG